MVRGPLWMGAAVAMGCGGGIEGRWTGECEVSTNGQAVVWDLELDIDQDKGGEIEGEAEISDVGFKADGDLEGKRDGNDVEMSFEIESGGYDFEIELEGTIDKDTMEGDCEIRGRSVNYLAQGEFELDID